MQLRPALPARSSCSNGRTARLSRPVALTKGPTRSTTACSCFQVFAFQPTDGPSNSPGRSSAPGGMPGVAPSRAALLSALKLQPPSGSSGQRSNVYGKPLSAGELKAWDAAVDYWSGALTVGTVDKAAVRQQLLDYLYDAAVNKKASLTIVEGSIAILEQLFLQDAPPGAVAVVGGGAQGRPQLQGVWSEVEMKQRWQLVVGADVGGIQYIPVSEVLTVTPPTSILEADLGGVVYAGFGGEGTWLSPGHLRYATKWVRLETRLPEGWERALKFLGWRAEQAAAGVKTYSEREPPPLTPPTASPTASTTPTTTAVATVPKEDFGRSDPSRPHLTLPAPLPTNELFCFASDGKVATVRASLGGLILLLNRSV